MTRLVWLVALVFLGACDGRAPEVADPYDPAKMDMKPTPARVTTGEGSGPFAAGSALSTTATLNLPMPNQNLSDAEIRQYLAYFRWIDAQPPGAVEASGAGH